MDLQNDELAVKILEAAKRFDETAYAKPWKNLKKNRPVANLHYGVDKPGIRYRSQIRCAKKTIYWFIGIHTSLYSKYRAIIDKYSEKDWNNNNEDETRIVFTSEEKFFAFVNECLGKSIEDVDINTAFPPKAISIDGTAVICPRCDRKFKRAERCPDCGQLIKYQED